MATSTLATRLLGMITGRLRYPQLFFLLLGLFLFDLVVPDLIPFLDEILLGLLTALVGSLREGRGEETTTPATKPPEKNVTPQ